MHDRRGRRCDVNVYEVTIDEWCKEDKDPMRLDPLMVLAKDGETAMAKARKARVGHVYTGEIEGEPYKSTVERVTVEGLKLAEQIDVT